MWRRTHAVERLAGFECMLSWRLNPPLIRAMECPAAAGCMYHLKRLPATYMIAPPQPFETYTFDAPEIAIGLPSQQQRTCRFVGNCT